MANVPIQKIVEASENTSRYRFTLAREHGIKYQGITDEKAKTLNMTYSTGKFKSRALEVVQSGTNAFGKPTGFSRFFKLKVPGQFPRRMAGAASLLKNGKVLSAADDGDLWRIDLDMNDRKPGYQPENIVEKIFLLREWDEKDKEKMRNLCKGMKFSAQVWASKKDFTIKKANVTVKSSDIVWTDQLTFESTDDRPTIPAKIEQDLKAPEMFLPVLLTKIPSVGGWRTVNHCYWAQMSIDMIKDYDTAPGAGNGRYAEIYDDYWGSERYHETGEDASKSQVGRDADAGYENIFHPLITSCYWEDQEDYPEYYKIWFSSDPKYILSNQHYFRFGHKRLRDYNHFGGREIGLDSSFYYSLRDWWEIGSIEDPPLGDRYYSARNWGYGSDRVDQRWNMLTFTEAIKQYNRHTADGKRLAYLMLGHVLHLLQDMGNADHARLSAHPMSSFTEAKAFEQIHVCEVLAAEISAASPCPWWDLVCEAAVALSIYLTCKLFEPLAINDEMGYERLITEKWMHQRVDWDRVEPICRNSYDAYFRELSDFSMAAADSLNLDSPLGLGYIKGIPIPGLDPDISTSNMGGFLRLTDEVVPKIVGYGAGFIRYFYEIVNHPPFVQRVVIVSINRDCEPAGFRMLDRNESEASLSRRIVYEACWEDDPADRDKRLLKVSVDKKMLKDKWYMIFVQFGPDLPPHGSKTVRDDSLVVSLDGTARRESLPISIRHGTDPTIKSYYWGTYKFSGRIADENQVQLKISARDASAHLDSRAEKGDELDRSPDSKPKASPVAPFNLVNYSPGTDANHMIKASVTEKDRLEPNDSFATARLISLDGASAGDDVARGFDGLNLHDAIDVDYFRVEFTTSPWSAETAAEEDTLCLVGTKYHPPFLSIEVNVANEGGYVSVETYDSGQHSLNNHREFHAHDWITAFENPAQTIRDRVVFFRVRNENYDLYGPLSYGVTCRINPPKRTVKMPIQYREAWDRNNYLTIVSEGINPKEVEFIIHDVRRFVEDFRAFVPRMLDDMKITDPVERRVMTANVMEKLKRGMRVTDR